MFSQILEIDREKHPFADVLRTRHPRKKRLTPREAGEPLVVVDLFSGAGGTTSGVIRALQSTGRQVNLVTVNHWAPACDTMRTNYPDALVFNASVEVVDPFFAVPGGRIDLLVASPECFPAQTMILTSTGVLPIEDVRVGMNVLTHKNRWRRVTALMQSQKDTIILRGHGHYGLETTREHPIYTKPVGRKWNNSARSYDRKIGAADWTKAEDTYGHLWSTPRDLEMIPVPPVGGRGMSFSPAFWWMVGRWLGDGCLNKIGSPNPEITICCGKSEGDQLQSLLDLFQPQGNNLRAAADELRWRRRDTRTATLFETAHKGLSEWLLANFGQRAHSKRLPAWALTMPPEHRRSLLNGYLSTDGSLSTSETGLIEMTAQTTSKALAIGVKLLAESLGEYVAMYRYDKSNVGSVIEGRTVHPRDQYRLSWFPGNTHGIRHIDDGKSWHPIKDVTAGRTDIKVFNFEVEEDNSYVADGIVVHNCVQYSSARGDKPIYDQSRSSAAFIYEWLTHPKVHVDTFCLENVSEWSSWGPLDEQMRPIKERRGEYFDSFLNELRKAGYALDHKVLNSADYGDATSRRRIFVLGRSDGEAVQFPSPTHAENPAKVKGVRLKKWRSAREIIDWSVRGHSIFNRKGGPHSPKSIKRMRGGFAKQTTPMAAAYVEAIDRFLPIAEGFNQEKIRIEKMHSNETKEGREARQAAKAAAVREAAGALLKAFQTPVGVFDPQELMAAIDDFVIANRNNASSRTDGPMPAITSATGGGIASVTSSMILGQHGGETARTTAEPLPTVATSGAIAKFDGTLVDASLMKMNASDKSTFDDATRSVGRPLATIVAKDCTGIAVPVGLDGFVFPINHGGGEMRTQTYDTTLGTLTTKRSSAKVDPTIEHAGGAEAFISPFYGESNSRVRASRDLDQPVSTITTNQRHSLVSPELESQQTTFIMPQRGESTAQTSAPVPTVVTIARIGLVAGTEPFVAEQRGFYGEEGLSYASRPMSEPLSSITAHTNHHALVDPALAPEPFVSHLRGYFGDARLERASSATSVPLDTIAASGNHHALVESRVLPSAPPQAVDGFITANFGERTGQETRVGDLDEPTWTATGRGAGNLVTPEIDAAIDPDADEEAEEESLPSPSSIRPFVMIGDQAYQIDVLFRMLLNRELAKAMSFIDQEHDYEFTGGTAAVTRQIGNAVPVRLATALVTAQLRFYIDPTQKKKKGRVTMTMLEAQLAA